MDAIPTPNPTKILPTMITEGVGARAITSAPAKKRASATKIDFFLPNLSLIHPPTAAPKMAPATAMLTMVSFNNAGMEEAQCRLYICKNLKNRKKSHVLYMIYDISIGTGSNEIRALCRNYRNPKTIILFQLIKHFD